MRFLYKINSSFDGFSPKRIPERMHGRSLVLGWKRYVDAVDLGDEIWIYFKGPHRFEDGVYAKGIAENVDYAAQTVVVRVTEYDVGRPLTDLRTSARIASVVATRYRQVFFLPDELDTVPSCTLAGVADTCEDRNCGSCPTWRGLPTVDLRNLVVPWRLRGHVDTYAPGFWSIPSRSYLYRRGHTIRPGIVRTSNIFYRFKTGDTAVSHPLALAARTALAKARRLDFDAIVAVPLSPDKAAAGEVNRTLTLGRELGLLLDTPVRESWLQLDGPISKKRLRVQAGLSAAAFEGRYLDALTVSPRVTGRVLLVDDVCTEGSTLRVCADALYAQGAASVVATTAAQMAVRNVVRRPEALWVP